MAASNAGSGDQFRSIPSQTPYCAAPPIPLATTVGRASR